MGFFFLFSSLVLFLPIYMAEWLPLARRSWCLSSFSKGVSQSLLMMMKIWVKYWKKRLKRKPTGMNKSRMTRIMMRLVFVDGKLLSETEWPDYATGYAKSGHRNVYLVTLIERERIELSWRRNKQSWGRLLNLILIHRKPIPWFLYQGKKHKKHEGCFLLRDRIIILEHGTHQKIQTQFLFSVG